MTCYLPRYRSFCSCSYPFIYVIAALGDAALGIFLNKLPSTISLDTAGGPANLGVGTGGVTAEQDA